MPVSEFVRAMPKVQLHCHLEGTVRAVTFRELARRYGLEGERARGPLEQTYALASFREFLLTFAEVCKALRTPEDFARVAADYAGDAAAQGVRYAEVFISPSVWTFFHRELDVRACVAAMREVLERDRERLGLEVAFICDLTRNFGVERALATAKIAAELAEAGLGVIGVGLGGDEANFPPAAYLPAFEYARTQGLHLVAHAGEAAGPQSVWDALDVLGAERIGHGVRALEDARLVETLVQRGVALELCPTSNRLTGAVPADRPHPIGALDERGVVCTIDADDPALFSTTLCEEYALVGEWLGEERLLHFARNAVRASFAPGERKSHLINELYCFDVGNATRRRTG